MVSLKGWIVVAVSLMGFDLIARYCDRVLIILILILFSIYLCNIYVQEELVYMNMCECVCFSIYSMFIIWSLCFVLYFRSILDMHDTCLHYSNYRQLGELPVNQTRRHIHMEIWFPQRYILLSKWFVYRMFANSVMWIRLTGPFLYNLLSWNCIYWYIIIWSIIINKFPKSVFINFVKTFFSFLISILIEC